MDIGGLINEAELRLRRGDASGDEERLAAEVLLGHVTGFSREKLFLNRTKEIDRHHEEVYVELIERHRRGEPVAYLTKKKEFFGLDFYVDRNVLIPRPETEMLVERVIDFVKEYENAGKSDGELVTILDVGTGCGNIAVSLAHALNNVHVTASDLSATSIEVAKKNAVTHGVANKMDFLVSDLLENVEGEYDVIVANLPYIGEVRHNYVSREAYEYEPHMALFGGENGLHLYEKLFGQIAEKKIKPALIAGEFGFLQGEEIRSLLGRFFEDGTWTIEEDLASIERIFVVKSAHV